MHTDLQGPKSTVLDSKTFLFGSRVCQISSGHSRRSRSVAKAFVGSNECEQANTLEQPRLFLP